MDRISRLETGACAIVPRLVEIEMTARDEILARVRSAAGSDLDTGIERDYIHHDGLSPDERIELFIERLEDYDCAVHETALDDLPALIARVLENHGKQRIAVPAGFPANWLPREIEFLEDHSSDYQELDRLDGVITTCTVAVALTGTLILQHGAGQGRRALTLIPDYHLCIVRTDQIVGTVPEALALLDPLLPTTTISGPSATSDIEMTRIRGVHGPRTLEVILLI